jgi:acetyl-CoA carboxylase biotin carboxylase subunit
MQHAPTGPGIRLDEGVYEGYAVPMEYDPLLSKLIAWGNSREETIARLRRALDEYTIAGIRTNVNLFRRILGEPEFLKGEIHTRWLDELLARPRPPATVPRPGTEDVCAIAAAFWVATQTSGNSVLAPDMQGGSSRWKAEGRKQQVDRQP